MSFKAQIITVFISSPNDVSDDRQVVLDELHAWNQRNGRARGCYLSPLTWEDLVAPDFGNSTQDVINVAVGDEYDVFLGLMWGRFGTPTDKAESGTQEEFERALARKTSGEALRISFLFKKADLPFDKTDPEQLMKVKEFKQSIAKEGGFYAEYSDDRELVSGLTAIFDNIANEKERYAEGSAESAREKLELSEVDAGEGRGEDVPEGDEEIGLFDLEESLNETSGEFVGHLDSWAKQFTVLTQISLEVTDRINELSQFGQPDRQKVRDQIDRVTGQMVEFSHFGEEAIERIEVNLDDFYSIFSKMISVSKDFEQGEEDVQAARRQTQELIETVKSAKSQMSDFIVSLERLPRLDKRFVRARNGVLAVHRRLRKKMEVFEQNMASVLKEL